MPKTKVAILGGGAGSLTAAYYLSRTPPLRAQYDVTVYQMGWRLGGQGASGRNRQHHDRIEEHGLHLWMGWYANAFAMMRECWQEWEREPDNPLQDWTDAFKGHVWTPIGMGDGRTYVEIEWPTNKDVPGDGQLALTPWGALTEGLGIVKVLLQQVLGHIDPRHLRRSRLPWLVLKLIARLVKKIVTDLLRGRPLRHSVALAGHVARSLHPARHVGGLLHGSQQWATGLLTQEDAVTPEHAHGILWLLEEAQKMFHGLFGHAMHDGIVALFARVLDTGTATLRGLISLGHWDLNEIDGHEYIDWLLANGASDAVRDLQKAPELRALYDLAFAYQPTPEGLKPNFAAGAAVRALIRIFGTYKGSPIYEMQAGMGEAVIAPLYEVLKARGVRFEFFRKVTRLELSENTHWVRRIHLGVQADVKEGREYDPLFTVKGVRCWPSEPFWEQLENGAELARQGVNFESHWAPPPARSAVLELGRDFDQVILGINAGAFQRRNTTDGSLADELIAASTPFRLMTEQLGLIPTFGVQLWMTKDLRDLGWTRHKPAFDGAVEPMDVWADTSHLLPRESWPLGAGPRSFHFFCGPWNTDLHLRPATETRVPGEAHAAITDIAATWLDRNTDTIWPKAVRADNPHGLDWTLLHGSSGTTGAERLQSQWIRPNVDPTEVCVAAWAGTTQYRLRADESGFQNLVLAGTWTRNGINSGCVEAAVMSGMAAARAICGEPAVILGQTFMQSP